MKEKYIYVFRPHNEETKYYYANVFDLHEGMHAVCLGEIGNMPNHFIMASQGGNVIFCVHSVDFEEVVEDE